MRSGAVFIISHDYTLNDAREFKQSVYQKKCQLQSLELYLYENHNGNV